MPEVSPDAFPGQTSPTGWCQSQCEGDPSWLHGCGGIRSLIRTNVSLAHHLHARTQVHVCIYVLATVQCQSRLRRQDPSTREWSLPSAPGPGGGSVTESQGHPLTHPSLYHAVNHCFNELILVYLTFPAVLDRSCADLHALQVTSVRSIAARNAAVTRPIGTGLSTSNTPRVHAITHLPARDIKYNTPTSA